MAALRVDADDANSRAEELAAKVKTLEQENLAKEQEITSLTHRNQLLESDVEKLETSVKDSKGLADRSTQHSTENETLTRRLQLLEDEAEEADKNLREANDKYVLSYRRLCAHTDMVSDFARQTSRLATSSARYRPLPRRARTGRRSMRRWKPNTRLFSPNWMLFRPRLVACKCLARWIGVSR
jgi:predicted RNase H-like nuclease (RuvC/YqgF family)